MDKIKFENSKSTNDQQIQELENLYGLKFTNSLKDFLRNYSGATLSINGKDCLLQITHEDGWKDTNVIQHIETVDSIKKQRKYMHYLKDFQKHFKLDIEYVDSSKLLPIIELLSCELYIAAGGQHDGKIYYADNGDFGIIKVADSINELFNKLYSEA